MSSVGDATGTEGRVNDMRLIDADAIPEKEMNYPVWVCLKKQPTIDAVPVVRCRDCANKERPNGVHLWCYEHKRYVAPNDFCSYGE